MPQLVHQNKFQLQYKIALISYISTLNFIYELNRKNEMQRIYELMEEEWLTLNSPIYNIYCITNMFLSLIIEATKLLLQFLLKCLKFGAKYSDNVLFLIFFIILSKKIQSYFTLINSNNRNNEGNGYSNENNTYNQQSESESSSGLNEGGSGNNPDEDPEDSEDDVPNKEVYYDDDETTELERLDEDLEKIRRAIKGDDEAKEEIKEKYSEFFRHSCSEEEDKKALEQLEEELEEEFQDIEERDEAEYQAEVEAAAKAKAETEAEAESDSAYPDVTSGKRKASDTELGPNKRQDISDSNDDENNNGNGGPSGFPGGGGPSSSAGEGGPSSSGSLKTMVNEGEFSSIAVRNPGSPIDFIIELESTTCIHEDFNFFDEIL